MVDCQDIHASEKRLDQLGKKIKAQIKEEKIFLGQLHRIATNCQKSLAYKTERPRSFHTKDKEKSCGDETISWQSSITDTTLCSDFHWTAYNENPPQGDCTAITKEKELVHGEGSDLKESFVGCRISSCRSTSPSSRTQLIRSKTRAQEQQVRAIMIGIEGRMTPRRGSA